MAGKMTLYKLVVLGDGGVGKVSPSLSSPDRRHTDFEQTALTIQVKPASRSHCHVPTDRTASYV